MNEEKVNEPELTISLDRSVHYSKLLKNAWNIIPSKIQV